MNKKKGKKENVMNKEKKTNRRTEKFVFLAFFNNRFHSGLAKVEKVFRIEKIENRKQKIEKENGKSIQSCHEKKIKNSLKS